MSLLVIDPGVSTTVQDAGRPGCRAWGVPLGGAFDRSSADLANALLGNRPDCAVLEFTLTGGNYEARAPLALALAGAPMDARILLHDGPERSLRPPLAFPLNPGERLHMGGTPIGVRTYLAALGGWSTVEILKSRSREGPIRASELLPCSTGTTPVRHLENPPRVPRTSSPIRVIAGPDFARMTKPLDSGDIYQVRPDSNRMGLRLEGTPLSVVAEANRVSTPVAPGAIQVAGGQLLILGVACGTMGGYPHVAHVISADLDRIAQARPGDSLTFEMIRLEDARRLDQEERSARREWLRRITTAVSDRGNVIPG